MTHLLPVAVASALSIASAEAAEQAYFEDLPTVLTVSRLPQPLNDAPGAVTVIEGDFIRATGYRDLARIFRLVPGMQVGQERGNASWVTYHGQGNNFSGEGQLQVLIDGRSVYSTGAYGGVNWAALPLSIDEIERIEVVRGANGVTYGANAFLGVINIITRHSAEQPGWRVKSSLGDAGIADLMVSGSGSRSNLSWRATVGSARDDGFSDLNDYRRGQHGALRFDYRISAVDELMLRVAGSATAWGEGYERSFIEVNTPRELRNFNSVFHLKWTHAPAPNEELSVQFYRINERVQEQWSLVFEPPLLPSTVVVPVDRRRDVVRDHLEVQKRAQLNKQTQVVGGAEFLRDTVAGDVLFADGNPPPNHLYRLFSNVEWQFATNWRTNLGAAYERYRDEPVRLSPRFFVNWQFHRAHTLRAGYARAYEQRRVLEKDLRVDIRDPNSGDLLTSWFIANPDLRQARMDSYEISYLGRFSTWDSMVDVRLFNERTSGLPILRPVAPPAAALLGPSFPTNQSFNSEKDVVIRGVEYQIRTRPWHGAEWMLNHTMMRRTRGDADSVVQGAPYFGSLSWLQRWGGGWSTTLTALRAGPMSGPVHFSPAYPYHARAYTAYDARLAYARDIRGNKAEFSLNAINLGGRHQEQPDRDIQAYLATFGDHAPANRVSPMVYVTFSVEL